MSDFSPISKLESQDAGAAFPSDLVGAESELVEPCVGGCDTYDYDWTERMMPNDFVQATPVCALRVLLRHGPGAPDSDR